MTPAEHRSILIEEGLLTRRLYTMEELQRALYALGHSVPKEDLYAALKATGWIKLRLIRDRLLETKRLLPKHNAFGGLRQIVKWPLLVKRQEDLPGWGG